MPENAPAWVPIVAWTVAAIVSGIFGGVKLANRAHRHAATEADDEVKTESARILVQRAEQRLREYHDLRDSVNTILNGFTLRLVSLEKDVKALENNMNTHAETLGRQYDGVRDDMKELKDKLDAILHRVYSIPGGRRRADNGDQEEP